MHKVPHQPISFAGVSTESSVDIQLLETLFTQASAGRDVAVGSAASDTKSFARPVGGSSNYGSECDDEGEEEEEASGEVADDVAKAVGWLDNLPKNKMSTAVVKGGTKVRWALAVGGVVLSSVS
jgi:hypothetical protein